MITENPNRFFAPWLTAGQTPDPVLARFVAVTMVVGCCAFAANLLGVL